MYFQRTLADLGPRNLLGKQLVRALFFGTPAIAVPALRALASIVEVRAVVSQPDRAAGRGLTLTPPAVKLEAQALGLPVLQPHKLRDGALAAFMREQEADVALVMAYGRILPPDVLSAPRLGCLNVHASLLPEYRGAAPIQRCLMDGRTETGLCLMQMDEGLDTGDVLAERRIAIGPLEDAGELSRRLAELAHDMTLEELPRFFAGQLVRTPQAHERATHAPPLTNADLVLDFTRSAARLKDHVRALAPQPGATAFVQRPGSSAKRLRVLEARVADGAASPTDLAPGDVVTMGKQVFIGAGSGVLELLSGQVEGRKVLPAAQLAQGRALATGDRLTGSAS